MSQMEELEKAAQEGSKAVATVVEKGSNAIGFIAKYIDEPLSVLCSKWVDNKKFDRWENAVKIEDKVNAKLKERGCKTLRMIPPKLGIPLIDNALLEDDDDLRELWCNLIANSLDSDRNFKLKYVYIDIIKSLSPLDAIILKYIYDDVLKIASETQAKYFDECQVNVENIIENISAPVEEIYLSINNLKRVQCIWDNNIHMAVRGIANSIVRDKSKVTPIEEAYTLTSLGYSFILACII